MNIDLPPELEAFVARKVESGRYQTANEMVREGLQLLRERDEVQQHKLDELRKEIAIGIDQANDGKVAPLSARETLARRRGQLRVTDLS